MCTGFLILLLISLISVISTDFFDFSDFSDFYRFLLISLISTDFSDFFLISSWFFWILWFLWFLSISHDFSWFPKICTWFLTVICPSVWKVRLLLLALQKMIIFTSRFLIYWRWFFLKDSGKRSCYKSSKSVKMTCIMNVFLNIYQLTFTRLSMLYCPINFK